MKILSWNVNGIRAMERKGFLDWLLRASPDILCVQETKAGQGLLSEALKAPKGYFVYWNHAKNKRGYSGTAIFVKAEPRRVRFGFGNKKFDVEGRVIIAEYPKFTLLNIYFPNGKLSRQRLRYKLDFYDCFLKFVNRLKKEGKKVIICGDFNTAHKEIDLARPKANEHLSGFLPIERKWLDKFVKNGYVDTFRYLHPKEVRYSYWDLRTGARKRNIGWRIDYFFITKNLLPRLRRAFILIEVGGSDHCPVGVELDIT